MLLNQVASSCYDALLALIYPQPCAVCGASVEQRELGVACANCWRQTSVFVGTETICWKCGQPSLGQVTPADRASVRCHRCDEAHFTAARACGVYEGALRASVLNLKREPHLCAKVIEGLVRKQQQPPLNRATRIVPVPLHPERERERGFNQAVLIANELARATALPLDVISLQRTMSVQRHRAGMDAKGRADTVAGAFTVRHPALVAGERILLIDDVFTTGATVSSCAGALIEAGAAEVFVLTLARPIRY
jgi:ComF family protein